MCYKDQDGKKDTKILHSKLKSANWPNFKQLLNTIVEYVPRVNISVLLYDKEKDESNSKEDQDTVDTKLQGIRLNLYRFKNHNIKALSNKAKEGIYLIKLEIESITNPEKRKNIIIKKRKEVKESFQPNGEEGLARTTNS